jgi:hypothetical protein
MMKEKYDAGYSKVAILQSQSLAARERNVRVLTGLVERQRRQAAGGAHLTRHKNRKSFERTRQLRIENPKFEFILY